MHRIVMVVSIFLLAAFALADKARAAIVSEAVVYEIDGKSYEGYFVRNTALGDRQPVVLIAHAWGGLGAYEERRAQMLAEQGYAAFAIDLYGQGVRPTDLAGRKAQSGALYKDREEMRARLEGGLDALRNLEGVDPERVVAMGYCFGGAAILELARSGESLQGFVSFHGGLATPPGQNYSEVQAPVLILHGSSDPVAPMTEVAALAAALDTAGVSHSMEIYGGAPHSFTEWGHDDYRPEADHASWAALMRFLGRRLQ